MIGKMFISFEGPDGCGKTTHISHLSESLAKLGHKVVVTREPGGCPISEQVRRILLDKNNTEMTPVTEALLYAAARAQHVAQVIRPALDEGKIVITDRYIDSSYAYQGYGRGLGWPLVQRINAPAMEYLFPDLTVLMLIDQGVADERLATKDKDRLELENADFLAMVNRGFTLLPGELPNCGRFLIVDASQSEEEIAEYILAAVLKKLNRWEGKDFDVQNDEYSKLP
jgi:dTMP kinase